MREPHGAPVEQLATPAHGRVLAALAVFLVVIATGIYVATRSTGGEAAKDAPPPVASEVQPLNKVFYDGIGAAPARARVETTQSSYTLELNLTGSLEEAEALVRKFKVQGVEAYFTPLSRGGHIVYRVRHGIYIDHDAAMKAQATLKTAYKIGAKVVQLR